MKLNLHYIAEAVPFDTTQFTEPDKSYTPRQIIEQFARNELLARQYDSTDTIDDAHFTEQQLEDEPIIEFEDELDAVQHLRDNQYQQQKEVNNETNASQSEIDPSSEASSAQTSDPE